MTFRNLKFMRGDTYPFTITVTNNGSAVNLYGAEGFRMTAKYRPEDVDASAVFTLTSPGYIATASASSGILGVTIPPSATSSLAPRTVNLYYDIQMADSASQIFTLASGKITVLPDISVTAP